MNRANTTWESLDDEENQQWSFQDNQLVYVPDTNKCVAVIADDLADGNPVGIWDCNGGELQQWMFDSAASTITSSQSNSNKCIRIHDEKQADFLEIFDCNGDEYEIWSVGIPQLFDPFVV